MATRTSTDTEDRLLHADDVAMGAVFAAAVFVGTAAVAIPVGIGFLNFGEIIIYTAAFLFGPIIGAIAGTGAAFADVALGYTFFAPITLVVKGAEGLIVGHVSGRSRTSKIVAVAAGAPIMIIGYFATVAYLQGIPFAVGSELPIDILQATVGLMIALPLSETLEDRLPRLSAERRTPTEGSERNVISAFLWMGFLSSILFWVPVLGGGIAGIVGGRKASTATNAVIASVIPAFIAGGALMFVITTFGLPVVGPPITNNLLVVVAVSSSAVIIGAVLGSNLD